MRLHNRFSLILASLASMFVYIMCIFFMTLAFGSAKMKVRDLHTSQLISAKILSYKYLLELESNFADSNQSDSEFLYDGNFTRYLKIICNVQISYRINWWTLFPLGFVSWYTIMVIDPCLVERDLRKQCHHAKLSLMTKFLQSCFTLIMIQLRNSIKL